MNILHRHGLYWLILHEEEEHEVEGG